MSEPPSAQSIEPLSQDEPKRKILGKGAVKKEKNLPLVEKLNSTYFGGRIEPILNDQDPISQILEKKLIQQGTSDVPKLHSRLCFSYTVVVNQDGSETMLFDRRLQALSLDNKDISFLKPVLLQMRNEEICAFKLPNRESILLTIVNSEGKEEGREIPLGASILHVVKVVSGSPLPKPTNDEERLEFAEKQRAEGNDLFAKKKYQEAVKCYEQGLKYLEAIKGDSDCYVQARAIRRRLHFNTIKSLYPARSFDKLLALIDEIQSIYSEDAELYYWHARVLLEDPKRAFLLDEARDLARKAAQLAKASSQAAGSKQLLDMIAKLQESIAKQLAEQNKKAKAAFGNALLHGLSKPIDQMTTEELENIDADTLSPEEYELVMKRLDELDAQDAANGRRLVAFSSDGQLRFQSTNNPQDPSRS